MIRGLCRILWRIIKGILGVIFTIILIGVCVFIDARYIEPKLLTVKEQEIMTSKLRLSKPLKVVQFSDVHLGQDYTLGDFKRVVDKINELEPDVIIFTGDLIDDNKNFSEEEGATALLKDLQATYGKYAVYGNHDHGGNGTKRYARMMQYAEFTLLKDSRETISLENGQQIAIIGIDDIVLGHPNFDLAFKGIEASDFNLFVSHAPDVVDKVKVQPIDLQLSGHSHGGQVRLPFIGAPFTPPYGQKYVKGLYSVKENSEMYLYVNSGIGTSQLPYRFMNMPEITLLLLTSKA